jgi:hypothetical protein
MFWAKEFLSDGLVQVCFEYWQVPWGASGHFSHEVRELGQIELANVILILTH